MLPSIVFILICSYAIPVIGTNNASCTEIQVSNSLHNTYTHGIYHKMTGGNDCNGRSTYRHRGAEKYIFYTSNGNWMIGPTKCGTGGWISARSTAISPDRVTSTWRDGHRGEWVYSQSLQVRCYYPTPCNEIQVRNSSHHTRTHGIYQKMTGGNDCNGRSTYRHTGSETYIYYNSAGRWMIGSTKCVTGGLISARSTAISPDRVTSTWREMDRDEWVYSQSLQVRCYYPPPLCPRLTNIPNSIEYNYGRGLNSEVSIQCLPGYRLRGRSILTCVTGYTWNYPPPTCELIQCPTAPSPSNGAFNMTTGHVGDTATFVCFAGYQLIGNSEVVCSNDGHWVGSRPICRACAMGFYKEGENTEQCVRCPTNMHTRAMASNSRLYCVCSPKTHGPPGGPCNVVQCEALTAPEHGDISSCCQNTLGGVCNFKCTPGYVLRGSSSRTCRADGWTGTPTLCTACPAGTYNKCGTDVCYPCPQYTTNNRTHATSRESCTCVPGYDGPAGGPCEDINECETNNGGCNQGCNNKRGGFDCYCTSGGYVLGADGKTCSIS